MERNTSCCYYYYYYYYYYRLSYCSSCTCSSCRALFDSTRAIAAVIGRAAGSDSGD